MTNPTSGGHYRRVNGILYREGEEPAEVPAAEPQAENSASDADASQAVPPAPAEAAPSGAKRGKRS